MFSYQTNYIQIVFEYFGVFKNSHNGVKEFLCRAGLQFSCQSFYLQIIMVG